MRRLVALFTLGLLVAAPSAARADWLLTPFLGVSNSSFGINVGGGVMVFINDRVGIRGDIRYLRSLQDPEEDDEFDVDFGTFDFWRGTVGVTFKF